MSREDRTDVEAVDLRRASAGWLQARRADRAPDSWIDELEARWVMKGDIAPMWAFVLSLCADVSEDELEVAEMIGAGPLWTMVNRWPSDALNLIEAEVGRNVCLRQAVDLVVADDSVAAERLERLGDSG